LTKCYLMHAMRIISAIQKTFPKKTWWVGMRVTHRSSRSLVQRFHIKWKGYSHIHNTDETYSFLKGFKGFRKVENYVVKVWTVEQAYHHPAPGAAWQPSREELEQYEIDSERIKEVLESYKVVERILDQKEERTETGLASLFFCKWTSELGGRASHHSLI